MKRILPMIVALVASAAISAAQTPAEELKALQAAYAKEEEAFYADLRARADRGEAINMTGGPAKNYLPKAMAVAKKARHTAVADKALAWAVTLAYQSSDSFALEDAINAMIENNSNSTELRQSMMFIGYGIQDKNRAIKLLSRVEHYSTDRETKAQAVAMRGGLFYDDYMGTGDIDRAKGIFQRVIDNYPGTEAAKKAKNTIFAMDNLGVGKMAPDFTATDQDGVDFKLSDYRGKVVVVAFWGFW
jgi:TolA-binding protein